MAIAMEKKTFLGLTSEQAAELMGGTPPVDKEKQCVGALTGEEFADIVGSGGGGGGTTNYNSLSNKPSINNITLTGNKTAAQLQLASASAVSQAQSDATTALSNASQAKVAAQNAATTASAAQTQATQNKTSINTLNTKVASLETDVASKAAQSDVDALTTDLGTKATKGELQTLSNTVDSKADKTTVTALSATVDTKADQSDLDALSSTVDTKATKASVDNLTTAVGQKASQTSVDNLTTAVTTLNADSSTVGSVDYKVAQALATSKGYTIVDVLPTASASTTTGMYVIAKGQADAGQIYITVDDGEDPPTYSWYNVGGAEDIDLSGYLKLADYTANRTTDLARVSSTEDAIDTLQSDLTALTTEVGTKADSSTVTALTSEVGTKASQASVTALSETVADKADQSEVDTLEDTVDQLSTSVQQNTSNITSVTQDLTLKQDKLLDTATSAGSTTVEEAISEFDSSVSTVTGIVNQDHTKAVTMYDTYASIPSSNSGAVQLAVGEKAYAVDTKKWYRVTAVDATTSAVTWEEFDPHIGGEIDSANVSTLAQLTALVSSSTNIQLVTLTADIDVDDTTVPAGAAGALVRVNSGTTAATSRCKLLLTAADNGTMFSLAWTGTVWTCKEYIRNFIGTTAEWEALSDAEKATYTAKDITDDVDDDDTLQAEIEELQGNVTTLKGNIATLSANKLSGMSAEWCPSNGFDPLTASGDKYGFQMFSTNPSNMIKQGAPTNFSLYATVIVFTAANYKTMLYIDVFGSMATWASNTNAWKIIKGE